MHLLIYISTCINICAYIQIDVYYLYTGTPHKAGLEAFCSKAKWFPHRFPFGFPSLLRINHHPLMTTDLLKQHMVIFSVEDGSAVPIRITPDTWILHTLVVNILVKVWSTVRQLLSWYMCLNALEKRNVKIHIAGHKAAIGSYNMDYAVARHYKAMNHVSASSLQCIGLEKVSERERWAVALTSWWGEKLFGDLKSMEPYVFANVLTYLYIKCDLMRNRVDWKCLNILMSLLI